MGLDAIVMCRCWAEGRAAPPPFPARLLELTGDGFLALADDRAAADLYDQFDRWVESACPHRNMELASERIGSWSRYRQFQEAIDELGRDRFPVLAGELPAANEGHLPAERAALALGEIERLRQIGEFGHALVLVDTDTGAVIAERLRAHDGVFLFGGDGTRVGLAPEGLFVESAAGEPLFRARRVAQRVGNPLALDRGRPDAEVELLDLDTGDRVLIHTGIPAEEMPWPDGRAVDEDGRTRRRYPAALHVEARARTTAELEPVIAPLERVCRAAVDSGNPVRWC